MANILPLDAQKNIWSMYRARFLIAASLVSLALSALAAIALIPSYLVLHFAAPPVSATQTHTGNTPADVATIARTQALLTAVSPLVLSTSSPSSVILIALNERPKGVVITHITYTTNPAQITFAGTGDRTVISGYRDTLSKIGIFSNVSIPVGSLIGADNGFTMSLTGNF